MKKSIKQKIRIKIHIIENKIKDVFESLFYPEKDILWKIIHAVENYKALEHKEVIFETLCSETIKLVRDFKIRKIKKFRFRKKIEISLMRPGLFIGKHGVLLNFIQNEIGYKIKLKELRKEPSWIEETYNTYSIGCIDFKNL